MVFFHNYLNTYGTQSHRVADPLWGSRVQGGVEDLQMQPTEETGQIPEKKKNWCAPFPFENVSDRLLKEVWNFSKYWEATIYILWRYLERKAPLY